MPSFNGWELLTLVVLAVLIFGPDKLPELARKTARVVHFLRNVANNATTAVKAELGPEYADLKPSDLNPKALVKRELDKLGLEEMKQEMEAVREDVLAARDDVVAVTSTSPDGPSGSTAAPRPDRSADGGRPLFDPDAT